MAIDLVHETKKVSAGSSLTLPFAPGGGWVGRLQPADHVPANLVVKPKN